MFCAILLFNAVTGHSLIALCGGIAVLFLLQVAAPFLLALSFEDDPELEDETDD
jgi:hypothetical protein